MNVPSLPGARLGQQVAASRVRIAGAASKGVSCGIRASLHPVRRSVSVCATDGSEKAEAVKVGDGERVALTSTEQAEVELEAFEEKEEALEGDLKELAGWVAAACVFGAGIWATMGADKGQEYFAGYLLEQSLSIDNLFVFVLVFGYFDTPPAAQKRALSYGIYSAAVLRLGMILAGTTLIEQFRPLLLVFAGILVYSSYGLLTGDEDDDADLADNFVFKACRKVIKCSDEYDGDRFFTTVGGERVATPLLLTLAVIELSDVVFAVDSIPAVFGVTLDPFVIYTSNMFAILSLRALFAFVADVMDDLHFLDKAVAVVLGFIGAKLVLEFAGVEVPTDVSLGVVASLLAGGVGLSYLLPEPEESS